MKTRTAVTLGIVTTALLVIGGYGVLCSCVTGIEAATGSLRRGLGDVLRLEQAYRQQHGRYTASLAELGYRPHADDSLTLTEVADTALRAVGTSGLVAGFSCSLLITPGTTDLDDLSCAGGSPGR